MLKKVAQLKEYLFSVSENKILHSYREKIIFPVSIIGVIVSFPFGIYHAFWGELVIAMVMLVACSIFISNALAIHHKTKSIIPLEYLSVTQIIGINFIIYQVGIQASFWSFQTLLLFYFFYSRRFANICGAILAISTSVAVFSVGGNSMGFRYMTSIVSTFLAINFIIKVLEDLHSKLLDDTIKDHLTGAYNRRFLNTKLGEAIARKKRRDIKSSILLFDLDHFKKVNDTLGHAKGDEILKEFVNLVRVNTRLYDSLFRMGGEEFLLYLPDAEEENAVMIADKIQKAIAENPFKTEFPITVTIGASELNKADTIESWINSADAALYHGKKTGRNRITNREYSTNYFLKTNAV